MTLNLTGELKTQLETDGFIVVKDAFTHHPALLNVKAEIERISHYIAPDFDPWGPNKPLPLNDHQRSSLYKCLRYLPSLMALASAPDLIETVRDLGLVQPAVMQSCNIRMDFPSDADFLFHWHQDLTYLLGSPNALTLWMPLTQANLQRGTIEVVPKTHTQGVLPIHYASQKPLTPNTRLSPKDVYMQNEPTEPGLFVDVDFGDVVIFNQLLVHRSVANPSDHIRWTLQLRYADLMNDWFYLAGYPFGDATNIYHTPYLTGETREASLAK